MVGAGAAGGGNVPVVLRGLSFKNSENQNQGKTVKSTDNSGKDAQLSAV